MPKQAIVLIDHGSAHGGGNASLARLASIVSGRLGLPAYIAHMSGGAPTLADAVTNAVADGAEGVIVTPCLLGAGRHVRQTIPDLIAEVRAARPELAVDVTDPIGFDAALAEPIVKRIRPHVRRRELP